MYNLMPSTFVFLVSCNCEVLWSAYNVLYGLNAAGFINMIVERNTYTTPDCSSVTFSPSID